MRNKTKLEDCGLMRRVSNCSPNNSKNVKEQSQNNNRLKRKRTQDKRRNELYRMKDGGFQRLDIQGDY